MKSNLEQNFKDAFEEYELPYNSSAWTALSDKLDKLQGAPTKAAPSNHWKWISGVAVLAIITTTAIVFTTSEDGKQTTNTSIAENKTPTVEKTNSAVSTTATTTNSTQINTNETIATQSVDNSAKKNINLNNTPNIDVADKSNNENTTLDGMQQNTPIIPFVNPLDFVNKDKVYFPEIAEVCEGSVVAIPNKNKTTIILVSPSGKKTEIKASSSIYYTLTESGTYSFVAKNSSETASFNVKEAPKVDFTIDMSGIIYEDGIPSIALQALTEGSDLVWSFEGSAIKQRGTQAAAHFYKKGNHEVTLTSKGTNGCEASISKGITIENDYNLIATNSFKPDGINVRFIPEALKHRNTEFRMYIIEPRSGAIIFETSSLEGWDGITTSTNQLVEENKSFIWKVVLANPEPEEKREYKGIVTRL